MSERRLIPESQLVFSAELAAAVGLEEAVLLQQIKGLYLHQPATQRDGLAWLHVSRAYLLQLLPFWSETQMQRICDSLEGMGLISIDRQSAARDSLLMAINESPTSREGDRRAALPAISAAPARPTRSASQEDARAREPLSSAAPAPRFAADTSGRANKPGSTPSTPTPRPGKREGQPLPPDFQPSEDMLELLERFHGVPRAFALQQVEDFTLYWRERGSAGHAWQNRFKQHVQFQWARQQQDTTGGEHAGQRGTGTTRRTRDSSLEHDLTDTSWAD